MLHDSAPAPASSASEDALLDAKKAAWTAEQLSLAQRAEVPPSELYSTGTREGNEQSSFPFVHTRFPLDGLEAALDQAGDGGAGGAKLSPSWSALRRQLACDVRQQADLTAAAPPPPLTYIGGVDISFIPGTNDGIACLAVLHYPSLTLVKTYMHRCTLTEPYLSSFLAFREIEPVRALFHNVADALAASGTTPQLLLVDGNGVHHPRRCGLATHLGVALNIPTIGCSKKILEVDGITRERVEEALTENISAAPYAASSLPHVLPLVGTSAPGALYGYAVHGQRNSVKKCIFVSPGHCIGFAVATALVVTMLHHRIPEPIRAADLGSRAFIRETLASTGGPGDAMADAS